LYSIKGGIINIWNINVAFLFFRKMEVAASSKIISQDTTTLIFTTVKLIALSASLPPWVT
jgi:hypothetical protein